MTAAYRNLVRPDAVVLAWLDLLPASQAATLQQLHDAVMAAQPALRAEVKWGNVHYAHDRRTLVCLTPSRRSVQLQLMGRPGQVAAAGMSLERGPGSYLVSFRHHVQLPRAEITDLVRKWAAATTVGRGKAPTEPHGGRLIGA